MFAQVTVEGGEHVRRRAALRRRHRGRDHVGGRQGLRGRGLRRDIRLGARDRQVQPQGRVHDLLGPARRVVDRRQQLGRRHDHRRVCARRPFVTCRLATPSAPYPPHVDARASTREAQWSTASPPCGRHRRATRSVARSHRQDSRRHQRSRPSTHGAGFGAVPATPPRGHRRNETRAQVRRRAMALGATGRDQVTSLVALYGPRTTVAVALDDGVYARITPEGCMLEDGTYEPLDLLAGEDRGRQGLPHLLAGQPARGQRSGGLQAPRGALHGRQVYFAIFGRPRAGHLPAVYQKSRRLREPHLGLVAVLGWPSRRALRPLVEKAGGIRRRDGRLDPRRGDHGRGPAHGALHRLGERGRPLQRVASSLRRRRRNIAVHVGHATLVSIVLVAGFLAAPAPIRPVRRPAGRREGVSGGRNRAASARPLWHATAARGAIVH